MASSASRRRSGAVGARPSRPARASGSTTRAERRRGPRPLDRGEQPPTRRPTPAPPRRTRARGRAHRRPASRRASGSDSAARQRPRPSAPGVELARAGAARHAHDLGDGDDAARAVRPARLADHEVERVGDLLAQRRVRQAEPGHQRERLDAPQRLGRRPGVHRGQRAVVAGRQRGQHVERLALRAPRRRRSGPGASAARCARAGGSSPRRGPRRSAGAPRAGRRAAGAARSSAASSIVTTRSSAPMNDDSALSVVVLPEPVPPQTRIVARARTARARKSSSGRVSVPFSTRSSGVKPRRRKRRIVSAGPVERQRRDHDVDARAVGQPRVGQRLGLVDPPAERREDPLDRVAQVALAREARPRCARAARRARPTPAAVPETMISSTSGSAQQRLERAEPERALGDPGGEPLARARVEHGGLAVHERADPLRLRTSVTLPRRGQQPLAQRAGQRVEIRVHGPDRPAREKFAPGGRFRRLRRRRHPHRRHRRLRPRPPS